VVAAGARVAASATVGPLGVIEEDVEIGERCTSVRLHRAARRAHRRGHALVRG
jgi:acyl-[acyl carrier protein]--UDP-N-acetylglucosamine O-acyltransferase